MQCRLGRLADHVARQDSCLCSSTRAKSSNILKAMTRSTAGSMPLFSEGTIPKLAMKSNEIFNCRKGSCIEHVKLISGIVLEIVVIEEMLRCPPPVL